MGGLFMPLLRTSKQRIPISGKDTMETQDPPIGNG
jgi:hypothetical protein